MRHAPLTPTITGAALACAFACAPSQPPALTVSLSGPSAPADGLSRVAVSARATGLDATAVVSFTLAGPGLLSATHARVQDGVATAEIFAPFESELTAGTAGATVTASAIVDELPVVGSAELSFTIPTGGPPVLLARATPDRVRAGSGEPIVLVIEGRRLTDAVVALAADSAAIELPQSITLTQDGALFHAEIEVLPPAEPTVVEVTVSGGGAPPVVIALHFIGDDDAAFDVTGTFAQVSYSVVEIGGLIFLDPDPQCVVAPSFGLVRVEQQGMQVTTTAELCDIAMPSVNVVLIGESRTWVDPSFVAAMNAAGGEVLTMEVGADGAFAPDVASLPPSVMGAELTGAGEALPTSADDPRVRDDDGDGHPGVTIHNSTQGDQYTVSRTRLLTMDGAVVDSDALDAVQTAATESVILNGGSGGLSPIITPMPSPSHLRRVDGRNGAPNIAARDGDPASVSCADVRAYAAELSAAAPGPDRATACQ